MVWLTSSKNRSLLLFTLAAVALRLILLIQYANQNPFYVHPIVDSALYLNWADAINTGMAFFTQEYHHPPGYAFFLALVLRTTGENLFAVLLLQMLMMTLLGLLIFIVTDDLLGRSSAWISYVLFTLCGPIAFYSMKVLSEPLYTLLLFGSFFFLWRHTNSWSTGSLFAAGLLLGAATEVRGNALICLIPAIAVIAADREKRVVKRLGIFFCGMLIFIVPVLMRNIIIANALSPVSSNWGENLYFGNHPDATGSFASAEGFQITLEGQIKSAQTEASRLAGKQLSSREAQSFWAGKALDYIRTAPGDWLKLESRKILKLFASSEASSIYYYGLETTYFQPFLKALFVDQRWIPPLFFLGLISVPEFRRFRLLLGFIAAQVLALLIFWPELRFLIPVYPFVFVVVGAVARIRIKDFSRKSHVAAGLIGLILCIVSNLFTQPARGQEAWFANAASAYYASGRNHDAERMSREAIKVNPNYADAWVNLGAALYAQNRILEARQAWITALRYKPDHLMALRNLALAAEEDNPKEALQLWQRALAAARAQQASPETISAIEAQVKSLL